jgi:RNase H-like domain found in reverse transcriptase
MQLLQDAHQGFHSHCGPVILQADKKGFRLQIRTASGESIEGFLYSSEPVMAFPKSDRQYALITDMATRTVDTPGGLGAILTQVDKDGNFHAISFASRQLKDHEMNYSPFLLEAAAAVWGMDFFNEYLKGKQFILYTDHKPLEKLGHLHSKTILQEFKQPYWSMTS